MKRILVLSTSPRKGGNSDILADEFTRGARDAGHVVEKICLREKDIRFCKGCLSCQKTQTCVIHDDAPAIVRSMQQADVLVFATPIYYYGMCGQMKTLLDRANPLFSAEYAFRDVYLLAAAADDRESAVDGAVNGLNGWISCFAESCLRGVVRGVGATLPGEIRRNSAALEAARKMGGEA